MRGWFHIGTYFDWNAAFEEEFARLYNSEDWDGLDDLSKRRASQEPRQELLLGARLQEKFDVALNLLGKSVWDLYDCWQPEKPKARRKANRFTLYGSILADLKRSVGMLESIVATWPVPSARHQAAVSATPAGALDDGDSSSHGLPEESSRHFIEWDSDAGTLRIGHKTLPLFPKGIRRAPEQEAILDAFQSEGWPETLELSEANYMNVKRLNDRIKKNNVPLVFHVEGGGQAIRRAKR